MNKEPRTMQVADAATASRAPENTPAMVMQSIRQMVRHLKDWIADLKEKKAALLEALQEAKEPTLPELLGKYLDLRREERTSWTSKGQLKGTVNDFNKVMDAIRYLREKELSTVESLDT